MFHAGEVIGDKYPGCFTIDTEVVIITMFVRIETGQLAIGDAFHFTFIAVFLFLIVIFDTPRLSGLSELSRIRISFSGFLWASNDFAFENFIPKFLLHCCADGESIESFDRVPEKEKSIERPW